MKMYRNISSLILKRLRKSYISVTMDIYLIKQQVYVETVVKSDVGLTNTIRMCALLNAFVFRAYPNQFLMAQDAMCVDFINIHLLVTILEMTFAIGYSQRKIEAPLSWLTTSEVLIAGLFLTFSEKTISRLR